MAFIQNSTTFFSFAAYEDFAAADLRLLAENESLTQESIEDALQKSTTRILEKIRASDWWRSYFIKRTPGLTKVEAITAPNPKLILSRQQVFTDLCVATAMHEIVLPSIADFSNESNAEVQKMGYYKDRAVDLLNELCESGDWYDFNADGNIQLDEKSSGFYVTKRIR